MNKKKLVKFCITFLKDNYSDRTQRYDKCERDLRYIIDAVEKDIKNNSTIFVSRVGNYFWYNGTRQISFYNVELAVYQFLLSQIKKQVSVEDYIKAEKSIHTLCSIIEQGPVVLKDTGSTIIEAARIAEHCQRNWDKTFVMPDADLDVLVKVATTMPAKQNRNYFDLVISTDIELNSCIFNHSIDINNSDTIKRNAQVDANVIFIYLKNKNFKNEHRHRDCHTYNAKTAIGISSGAVALAATQLNYRTGFCQCLLGGKILQELKAKGIDIDGYFTDSDVELILGIGKGNSNHHWGTVLDNDNKIIRKISGYNKTVKTTFL